MTCGPGRSATHESGDARVAEVADKWARLEKGERASSAGGLAPTSGPEGSGRSKLKRAGVSASGPGRGERGCRAIREGRCARALSGPSVGEWEGELG